MTGWGKDSADNAEWRDYAAQLRDEQPKPDPSWWIWMDYVMALVLGLCTAYFIAFVFIPFLRLLHADGVLP